MLACEMHATLGAIEVWQEPQHLAGSEIGEGAPRPGILVPAFRSAALELVTNARIDLFRLGERNADPVALRHAGQVARVRASRLRLEDATRALLGDGVVEEPADRTINVCGDIQVFRPPRALPELQEDASDGSVGKLAYRHRLLRRESWSNFHILQKREGRCADDMVRRKPREVAVVVDDHARRPFARLDAYHGGAISNLCPEAFRESVREEVGAAFDRIPRLFGPPKGETTKHQERGVGLDPITDAVEIAHPQEGDRSRRRAACPKEFGGAHTVELLDAPAPRPARCRDVTDAVHSRADVFLPHPVTSQAPLFRSEVEGPLVTRLLMAEDASTADVEEPDVECGCAGLDGQFEPFDVSQREVMIVRNEKGACIGVEAVRERLAQRRDAPAGSCSSLEHRHIVT